MPLQDFLAGAALFVVMLAAVAVATALVVRRRLRHLDPLETGLASVVIGTGVLIGVHLVPLMLGILSRGTVIAAAALAVGLAALVRPAAGAEEPEARSPAPPSSRASWAMAALACGFTAAAALANLGRWGGDEVIGDDPTSFHLPGIGRWIQDGTMWKIDQFVPLLAQGNYPNNGDVVLLSTILPWHNDFLVRSPSVFFLATTVVAAFAVARELRAPHAASLIAAAAVVSLPVVGFVTIPRALPDAIMWTTFACGVLFALRHARTNRRSDLVLAGVALGIAAGTKWYGVSSVPVVVAIWLVARAVAARTAAGGDVRLLDRGVVRDGALVGGLAFLGMLPWLARNLAESGNPVFPLNVKPFGVTIFSAPRDVIRDEVGFSIADYAGQPDVLGKVAIKIVEGLGGAPVLCAIGLVLAVVLARPGGRAPDPRVLVLAAAAAVLAVLYTLTPATALGLRDTPSLAHANTRYAIPALMLALPVLAWVTGYVRPFAARALELVLTLAVLFGAYDGYQVVGRDVVAATIALAAIGGAAYVLWRLRDHRIVLVGAAVGAALLGLAAADRMQDRINTDRYGHFDPGLRALQRAAPASKRVGLEFATYWSLGDLSPVWPAFGARIDNEVEFVGEFVDGFLTPYGDEASFREALLHGDYDVLVIGRSDIARQNTPAQQWAIDAGWRTISLTERLRVLVPPAAG
jgi:hypothetical protein